MGPFLTIAGVITGAALAANALLNALARSPGVPLVGGAFAVVAIGAYAASFVVDMVMLAWIGEVPAANVVWPCLTWSLVSISALAVAAGRPVPFMARAMPFWIFGGLAMFSSVMHSRNLIVGIALILAGVGYGSAAAAQVGGTEGGLGRERVAPKVRRGRAPKLGPYYFGMKTGDVPKLAELTPTEKDALGLVVEFKNERIYHAPPAEFSGVRWDVVLAAVEGRAYKVSALDVLKTREQGDGIWRDLGGELRTRLGAPATTTPAMMIWDTEDGNVVANRAEGGGAYAVVLTLTSRSVASFARVK